MWKDVINAWHEEVIHYHYPTGSIDGHRIGHYTQVASCFYTKVPQLPDLCIYSIVFCLNA